MKASPKSFVLVGLAIAACICLASARYLLRDKPPPFKVDPIPSTPRILSTAEVEKILQDAFTVVRKVSLVPDAVKKDYSLIAQQPFRMVNPGQAMSTDAIIPGVPNKALVFAGVSGKHDVLLFEVGGLADSFVVIVASHDSNGGVWSARLKDYSVHDPQSLATAIMRNQFTQGLANVPGLTWKP
jgi:hypothetical protein